MPALIHPHAARFLRLAPLLALAACAAPKAEVVAEPPAPVRAKPKPAAMQEPEASAPADDGIRLPEMLTLPGEGELRPAATTPGRTTPERGAVISRPPVAPEP